MDTVIVTGAAGGMGSAVCRRLLREGAAVVGIDSSWQRLEALTVELGALPFVSLCVDLGAPELLTRLEPLVEGARITGLVNLCGVSLGSPIEALSDEDWAESFAVNATAPMRLARFCAPLMREVGGGSLVNVSSPVGFIGAKKPSYAASKAALQGLTMSLARNLGPDGIRVNLLLPGPTTTFMTSDWSDAKRAAVAASSFLGRLCQPDDVAAVIRFLLSADASYMTGAIVDLTAGSMFTH